MRRSIVIVSDKMQRGYRDVFCAAVAAILTRNSGPIWRPGRCSNSACSEANTSPILS